jgi:hypothetical protein
MRRAGVLMVLVCMAGACNDDNDSPGPVDAGAPSDAGFDGSALRDASTPRSLLPRPGALERPPTALPDDLKPPR